MPIFISYSRKDREFVDTLAANLVRNRHHIWLDRWELNVGDSLIDKIQEALKGSSAILVVLSENSVESAWCKKELNAGLMRELEERNSILLPCVIDDCEIPLFLKEKLYADFRNNPDDALADVDRALARISNPMQGRSETPEFHIDWSVAWGDVDGDPERLWIEFTFVDHGENLPYVVMSQCLVRCNSQASAAFAEAQANDNTDVFIRDVLGRVLRQVTKKEMTILIDSAIVKRVQRFLAADGGQGFFIEFSCRRLGTDNGMDTVYYMDKNLHRALAHMKEVTFQPRKQSVL